MSHPFEGKFWETGAAFKFPFVQFRYNRSGQGPLETPSVQAVKTATR